MTSRHVFPLELVLICVFPACTHPWCGCRFPYGSFDCQTRRRSFVSPPRASSSHPVASRSAGECPSHTRPQPPPPPRLLHPGLLHRPSAVPVAVSILHHPAAHQLDRRSSPEGPTSRSTMEDLDVPQMRREVESLQYQLAINREKSSITVTELVKWIEGCVCEDPFLNPELMRANPWVEKGKCVIL
uniref:G protein gamma domain-containing protein n=5 Tax=Percomorphaceae TaxID=1489872 RepID=A0A674P1K6_TAKRU